jgi:diacylglycerol kinase
MIEENKGVECKSKVCEYLPSCMCGRWVLKTIIAVIFIAIVVYGVIQFERINTLLTAIKDTCGR